MHFKIYKNKILVLSISILIFSVFSVFLSNADAQSVDELENKIDDVTSNIDQLNKEIEEQTKKVVEINRQANTLQSTVNSLESTEKKISTDINVTEKQIDRSELTLEKLGLEIDDKTVRVAQNNAALAQAIRGVAEMESVSFLEQILVYKDFSAFFNTLHNLEKFTDTVHNTVVELKELNQELKEKHGETEEEKENLEGYKKELAGEKEAVAYTKNEKAKVLAITRNTEAEYQKVLQEKIRQRKEFEDALTEFESQLRTLIDPGSFPDARRGIISWPVDSVRITQNFGGSQFAKNNPHIYGRPFHNGTDFGIPIGTKIKSVLSGTVQATGNTDAFPGCNSWGKWVLVKHNNGLTSLYAHLSSILVNPGESVNTGETIALSGNTGVSTGPHLHLTLYASQGVEVRRFSDFRKGATGCAATGATTPVAPLDAYLDPMQYLPR